MSVELDDLIRILQVQRADGNELPILFALDPKRKIRRNLLKISQHPVVTRRILEVYQLNNTLIVSQHSHLSPSCLWRDCSLPPEAGSKLYRWL